MIHMTRGTLTFGHQSILDDLSFTCMPDQRMGLVGKNGSGKTTLLKVVAGNQQLESGSLAIPAKFQIAYLPQEVVLESERTIAEEAIRGVLGLGELLDEQKELEKKLEGTPSNADLERYGEVMGKLIEHNPEGIQAEAYKILQGLGFSSAMLEKRVDQLSTGWKMRLVLAKLLLQKADFYLFDEPTNHLDIFAQEWFVAFLKKAPFGFMIISHERYIHDQLCTHTLELDRGRGTLYTGSYSSYEQQKEANLDRLVSAQVQQQKYLAEQQRTIDRFRASPSRAKMVQSMIKKVEKVEKIELPRGSKKISIKFGQMRKPGEVVLKVNNLSFGYSEKPLFENVSFSIERGEKVALIAPNGQGKTTLFSLLEGRNKPRSGSIELGYNVDAAFFAQDYNEALDLNKTILATVEQSAPNQTHQWIRTVLGSFLFRNDDLEKKIRVLSGGEKNRVRMVIALLHNANVLFLDEPTNHLDIESKELLVQALNAYEGTLLFVSHDIDFINGLATRVLELKPERIESYRGNYDDYKYHVAAQQAEITEKEKSIQPKKQIASQTQAPKSAFDLGRKIVHCENKMKELTARIEKTEKKLGELDYASDEFAKTLKSLERFKKEHDQLFAEWEALEVERENLQ